jgi:hypothetical protein
LKFGGSVLGGLWPPIIFWQGCFVEEEHEIFFRSFLRCGLSAVLVFFPGEACAEWVPA